jgi:glycosyltransferase involved in cell wall biosynthesis
MPGNPRTIVVLTPAFPANESEADWVVSQQLFVRSVKEQFPDVHLEVLSFQYPQHTNSYQWNGVTVTAFNGLKQRKLKRLLLWRRVLRKMKNIHKERRIDGVLSFWCGECALVGKYFSKRNGIRHLIWVSGQDARAKNKFVRWIKPRADQLIGMSDFLVEEFERNHRVRPQYMIPNGIDITIFPKTNTRRDIDIIGVGSLSVMKQYDLFVEMIAQLRKTHPDTKAMLCGDGEAAEGIHAMVERLSLKKHLSLPGMVAYKEIPQLLQRSKIFLHPSSYEGFSTSIMEALYAGAHVISFVKAMNHDIPHWHIVKTKEEMLQKTIELLNVTTLNHEPVLVNVMSDSARTIMNLFAVT